MWTAAWSNLKKMPVYTASTTERSGQARRPRWTVSTLCTAPAAASPQLRISKSFTHYILELIVQMQL